MQNCIRCTAGEEWHLAEGSGEQQWLAPTGNLPSDNEGLWKCRKVYNSSVVASHWDLMLLVKVESSRVWHVGRPSLTFQVRSQWKKELCTKGADWGMKNIGSPGQPNALLVTSWIIITNRSVLPFPLPPATASTMSSCRQNLRVEAGVCGSLLCLGHRSWCFVLKDSHTCDLVMLVTKEGTDVLRKWDVGRPWCHTEILTGICSKKYRTEQ